MFVSYNTIMILSRFFLYRCIIFIQRNDSPYIPSKESFIRENYYFNKSINLCKTIYYFSCLSFLFLFHRRYMTAVSQYLFYIVMSC